MGKPFPIKTDQKQLKKHNQCQNAACEQKTSSEKWTLGPNKKLGLERTMNALGKPFRKKSNPKN